MQAPAPALAAAVAPADSPRILLSTGPRKRTPHLLAPAGAQSLSEFITLVAPAPAPRRAQPELRAQPTGAHASAARSGDSTESTESHPLMPPPVPLPDQQSPTGAQSAPTGSGADGGCWLVALNGDRQLATVPQGGACVWRASRFRPLDSFFSQRTERPG